MTVLGVAPAGANCTMIAFGPLAIADADYAIWAADGTINLTLSPPGAGVDKWSVWSYAKYLGSRNICGNSFDSFYE